MLGLYVSDHPLFGVEHVLAQHADTQISALTAEDGKPDGSMVTVAGLITGLQIKRTKKGDLWAIATVEDLAGAIECLFFPSSYMTVQTMLHQDVVAVVRGKVNRREDSIAINAQELTLPELTDGPRGPVVVTMETLRATTGRIEELKGILTNHPGSTGRAPPLGQAGPGGRPAPRRELPCAGLRCPSVTSRSSRTALPDRRMIMSEATPQPPVAATEDHVRVFHGDRVLDP